MDFGFRFVPPNCKLNPNLLLVTSSLSNHTICFFDRFRNYEPNSVGIFKELAITATIPSPIYDENLSSDDSIYFPTSVTTLTLPLKPEQYSFSDNIQDGNNEYKFSLVDFDVELLNFAVWGRIFERDGEEPTEWIV